MVECLTPDQQTNRFGPHERHCVVSLSSAFAPKWGRGEDTRGIKLQTNPNLRELDTVLQHWALHLEFLN